MVVVAAVVVGQRCDTTDRQDVDEGQSLHSLYTSSKYLILSSGNQEAIALARYYRLTSDPRQGNASNVQNNVCDSNMPKLCRWSNVDCYKVKATQYPPRPKSRHRVEIGFDSAVGLWIPEAGDCNLNVIIVF